MKPGRVGWLNEGPTLAGVAGLAGRLSPGRS